MDVTLQGEGVMTEEHAMDKNEKGIEMIQEEEEVWNKRFTN